VKRDNKGAAVVVGKGGTLHVKKMGDRLTPRIKWKMEDSRQREDSFRITLGRRLLIVCGPVNRSKRGP